MKKRFVGIPAFLICIVFSLSGVSVGLFSLAVGTVIRELSGKPLPASTAALLEVPLLAWMGGFFVIGVVAGWWFERSERLKGEVPSRSAGLIAILGLVMVLALLVSFAIPLVEYNGEVASRVPGSQTAIPAYEDRPHFELATQ